MVRNLIIRDGKSQKPLMVVTTVLDESGSMLTLKQTAIDGYNQYLEDCKEKTKNNKIYFGLLKFNSQTGIRVVHEHVLLSKIKKMDKNDYDPNECTPLYDAIWEGMCFTEKFIGDRTANVLFLIITDGLENASEKHTLVEIKDRIKEKEKQNWSFRFVGIEGLAEVMATNFGIRKVDTITYTHNAIGYSDMYNNLAGQTICWSDNVTNGVYLGKDDPSKVVMN